MIIYIYIFFFYSLFLLYLYVYFTSFYVKHFYVYEILYKLTSFALHNQTGYLHSIVFSYYKIVSGYVCNHGSPSGERDTASPRGRYGERPQRDSVWRYICKNTTCWPATAHDVTTGVPQYKCRREDTSSASSSEACVRSMAQSVSFPTRGTMVTYVTWDVPLHGNSNCVP